VTAFEIADTRSKISALLSDSDYFNLKAIYNLEEGASDPLASYWHEAEAKSRDPVPFCFPRVVVDPTNSQTVRTMICTLCSNSPHTFLPVK